MRALLLVTAALIIYGSLYPFNFSSDTYTPERMAQLADFSLRGEQRSNAIANMLLFLPWGLLSVALAWRPGGLRWATLATLNLIGLVIAYGVQVAQVFLAGRVPSGTDVVWNAVGALLGALAAVALGRTVSRWTSTRQLALPGITLPAPLLLVAGWLLYQWLPLVPTLDIGLLRDNVRTFLAGGLPSPFWVFHNAVIWLICLQLCDRYATCLPRGVYVPAILGIIGIGAVFLGSTVNIDDLAGAAVALTLWTLLGVRWHPALLALLLGLAVIGGVYLPLDWRNTPATFNWVPFSGALGNNVVLNAMATWKKLVLYGLLLWLLLEAGLGLLRASLLGASVLFVSEWFQVYNRGSTPEITDPLLLLGLGAGMALQARRGHLALPDGGDPEPTSGRRPSLRLDLLLLLVLCVPLVFLVTRPPPAGAAFSRQLDWAGERTEMILDLRDVAAIAGSERTTVLLPPTLAAQRLPRLRRALEHADARPESSEADRPFLKLIKRIRDGGERALLIYHPSLQENGLREDLNTLLRWGQMGTPASGVASAPVPRGNLHPDPWRAGGLWDQYTATGRDLWTMPSVLDASEQRHHATLCDAPRLHIAVPAQRAAGILEALDEGTFWTDQGCLLQHLSLSVTLDELPRPLYPGESADVFNADIQAVVRLDFLRDSGSVGRPLVATFISSCLDGNARVVARRILDADEQHTQIRLPLQATPPENDSCIIRADLRLDNADAAPGPLAVTNYVRLHRRLAVFEGRILDWRVR